MRCNSATLPAIFRALAVCVAGGDAWVTVSVLKDSDPQLRTALFSIFAVYSPDLWCPTGMKLTGKSVV